MMLWFPSLILDGAFSSMVFNNLILRASFPYLFLLYIGILLLPTDVAPVSRELLTAALTFKTDFYLEYPFLAFIGVIIAALILSTEDPIVSIRWNRVGSRSCCLKCKFGLYIIC